MKNMITDYTIKVENREQRDSVFSEARKDGWITVYKKVD